MAAILNCAMKEALKLKNRTTNKFIVNNYYTGKMYYEGIYVNFFESFNLSIVGLSYGHGRGAGVVSKYLFIIVTCIYKHNINIHIMVINSIICRANLAYNVTLYTNIAKEKGMQCAEEASITDINRSFSLTTPYTKKSVFLSNIW